MSAAGMRTARSRTEPDAPARPRAFDAAGWELLSERLAFLGNSLLDPLRREASPGLHEPFWDAFATGFVEIGCANERLVEGVERARRFARRRAVSDDDAVERVRVEHARLFVGPPKPAAPPWETCYLLPGRIGEVGFGAPAFDMRRILREAGLAVRGPSNQYADHMGLELLYAATVCARFAHASPTAAEAAELARFVGEHPASWASGFRAAIEEAAPDGYYRCIAETVEGLCRCLALAA